MMYYVEGNLRYSREISTICGGKKLQRLIDDIVSTGDECDINIVTEEGKIVSGKITTSTGARAIITFTKVDDFPESREKILSFINRMLDMNKKK